VIKINFFTFHLYIIHPYTYTHTLYITKLLVISIAKVWAMLQV